MNTVACPECGSEMTLRTSTKFKTNSGEARKFYGCSKYPECKGTHGANPDGTPMGTPADGETKALRQAIHMLLEVVFGKWNDKSARNKMYAWLKENAPQAHVGQMTKEQILETIGTLQAQEKVTTARVEKVLEHYMGKFYERSAK